LNFIATKLIAMAVYTSKSAASEMVVAKGITGHSAQQLLSTNEQPVELHLRGFEHQAHAMAEKRVVSSITDPFDRVRVLVAVLIDHGRRRLWKPFAIGILW
jgi:hypothetical protein